jgi:hypothetical protein
LDALPSGDHALAVPPAELVSKILELKEEFQRLALIHPWISLHAPIGENGGHLYLGVESAPYSRNEVTFLHPAKGKITVLCGWGVDNPNDARMQAAVDHAQNLTSQAEELLNRVLKCENKIPIQVQQEIRGQEERGFGYGWAHWLRFATVSRGGWRILNYPQVAVTGLWELKLHCPDPADAADQWSQPMKPKDWCSIFDLGWDTLKKRFADQAIRNQKLSQRSYRVAIDDIPVKHRDKFLGKSPV